MSEIPDYSAFVEVDGTDALKKLHQLGNEMAQATKNVERLEKELAVAKKRVVDLSETEIPELMDSVGLESFTTREGIPFRIKKSVFASITKANHFKAMKWLDENGHSTLARRHVIVEFSKEQEEDATLLTKALGLKYEDVDQVAKVHPSTLRGWAREQLEAGADVPLDLFGIHTKRIAKIG
jgi:hypothetical protein